MTDALHVRPYREGDAAKILPRWDFKAEHEAEGCPLFTRQVEGTAWTLVIGEDVEHGRPLACGGALRLDEDQPDAWSLWGYASELNTRQWTYVRKGIVALLAKLEAMGARQAVAAIRPGFEGARSLLAGLGFREVGAPEPYHLMGLELGDA